MKLYTLPIHRLAEMMARKEVTSEELTKVYLERISQADKKIKALISVVPESALTQARSVDKKRSQGEKLSPLAGIALAVSDNICTRGIKTTCASKMLANYIPPFSATAVEKLQAAGAVIIGKCNLDEFAMGSSTENSCFFATANPYDETAVPGGSGGGAAAAVAAGEAAFSLASDTGGGVRQPAAYCGVIGFKPTYGRVSRYGLVPQASSLEQIGLLTRDMTDLALLLNTVCGHDSKDSASTPQGVPDFMKCLSNGVKGLRIGLPREYQGTGVNPQVASKLKEAAHMLEGLGATCEEMDMPHTSYALPAYYLIAAAEASSNLARYDGVRYGLRVDAEDVMSMFRKTRSRGLGAEVKRRILLGTYVLSAVNYENYYLKALKVRTLVKRDFEEAFKKYDCLLTPTCLTTAYKAGEKRGDPLSAYLSDACTVPVNLAGVPAISLPFGMAAGLPVGLQVIAPHFSEELLLRIGFTLEQNAALMGSYPAQQIV